jgi:hypothetical protein
MEDKKISNENKLVKCPDVSSKVMQTIKKKHIRMKSHFAFLAEKIGLEAALVIFFSLGVLIISIIFHFFRKTKVFKFVKLGLSGFKIILLSFPLKYFILVLFLVMLSIYIVKKLDMPCRINTECGKIGLYLFFGIVFLGVAFSFFISEAFLAKWSQNKISSDQAIFGKIRAVHEGEVWVEDEDGKIVKVRIEDDSYAGYDEGDLNGKYLRAIGKREDSEEENDHFHADNVLCCDND